MPSICELKIELKKKGIKGISGLNKSGLEELLASGKSAPPKPKSKPVSKPVSKEAPKPKLLKIKELSPTEPKTQPKKYETTALKTLIRLEVNTEELMNDNSSHEGEKNNARKRLIDIQKAIALRNPKEVENEKKKLLEDIDLKQLVFMRTDLKKKIKNRKLPANDILKYRAQLTRLNKVFKAKDAALYNDNNNF